MYVECVVIEVDWFQFVPVNSMQVVCITQLDVSTEKKCMCNLWLRSMAKRKISLHFAWYWRINHCITHFCISQQWYVNFGLLFLRPLSYQSVSTNSIGNRICVIVYVRFPVYTRASGSLNRIRSMARWHSAFQFHSMDIFAAFFMIFKDLIELLDWMAFAWCLHAVRPQKVPIKQKKN